MSEGSRPPSFSGARTTAALALIGVVVVLAVIDAMRSDFALDSVQLGLMLGTALLMLGVEAGKRLIGGG